MPAYPVRIIKLDHAGILVRFPDVPEAVVCGETEQEVLENARPVLEAVLQGYVAQGRALPEPSDLEGAPKVATDRFDPGKWRPTFLPGRL
ncbi:type II toxin-antitoxin system HicB family antitoxin [Sphingosinicella sp. CPCC 101087]|uniref:type II toxin-antitoxin system HicB family antitoxin n=1 Tax=Sphingosinicella sp. CPCC 101087 TaxID=2497754 RepID=UPI00101C0F7B|nr:type II toxin-antitoxin system HicB family antitoxin [Sphingosinicella sp. CPCC 101087]